MCVCAGVCMYILIRSEHTEHMEHFNHFKDLECSGANYRAEHTEQMMYFKDLDNF